MKDQLTDQVKEVKNDVEEYVNANLELIKLQSAENLSRFFSGAIIKSVLFFLFFFIILFISLAIAIWLEGLFDFDGLGFLIVAGFYIVFSLLFLAIKKPFIERPIIQSFIHLFFPSNEP